MGPAVVLGLMLAVLLGLGLWRMAGDHPGAAPPQEATVSQAGADSLSPAPPDTSGATVANPPLPEPGPGGVAVAPAPLEGAEPTELAAAPKKPVISFGRRAGLHRVEDPLRLVSSAAVVVDPDSGEVLYGKNEDAVLPIASLTKLMTGLILMEAGLPMGETISITDEDVDRQRNSRSRLRVGTTLTRAEALHLALMSSENRAAHALGRTYPGGMNAFVDAMNNKARLMELDDTTFVDPTGLSNRNRSSAHDVALLAAAAAKSPLMRDYSTTSQRQVELGGRKLRYLNSNRLVRNSDWEIELQKTGYILEAGQCVAMLTRVGGDEVVMVLLDATSKGARAADARRLKKWVTTHGAEPQEVTTAQARS